MDSACIVLATVAKLGFSEGLGCVWGACPHPVSLGPGPLTVLLLKAVLQSRALRSGKSRVLPASGNSPPSPSRPRSHRPGLLTVGPAHGGFHKRLACSQHSWEGSDRGGSSPILQTAAPPGPSPPSAGAQGQGRATPVQACHSTSRASQWPGGSWGAGLPPCLLRSSGFGWIQGGNSLLFLESPGSAGQAPSSGSRLRFPRLGRECWDQQCHPMVRGGQANSGSLCLQEPLRPWGQLRTANRT